MITYDMRWNEMEPGKGFQRVDEQHPLDFYLGVEASGERLLLLVTEREATVPSQSHAIQVLCRQRHDGRWALIFRLIRPELNKIYSHLCEDLVESCRTLVDKSKAAEALIARFARWQRMLERSRTGLLDEAAMRGLIGELLFLRQCALPVYGLFPAVDGWIGPLDAEQDFRYPDSIFEVKTIQSNVTHVKISSAEQLDDADRKLQLIIVIVNPAEKLDTGAFCLPDMISDIRNTLEGEPIALSLFEERLLAVGYIDRDEYLSHYYQSSGFRRFMILEGFPRIIQSRLPTGINKVTYDIDLTYCKPFELNDGENADGP